MSNILYPDQAQDYVGPDLGPIYLQRLSEEDKKSLQQGKNLKVRLTNGRKGAETESNMLRPSKKSVLRVTGLKILGSVDTHICFDNFF